MAEWAAAPADDEAPDSTSAQPQQDGASTAAAAGGAGGSRPATAGSGGDGGGAGGGQEDRRGTSRLSRLAPAAAAAAASPPGSPAAKGRGRGGGSQWEVTCTAVLGHKVDLWQVRGLAGCGWVVRQCCVWRSCCCAGGASKARATSKPFVACHNCHERSLALTCTLHITHMCLSRLRVCLCHPHICTQVLFHTPFLERCKQIIAAALAEACSSIQEPLAAAMEAAGQHEPEPAGQLQPGVWPSVQSAVTAADGSAVAGMVGSLERSGSLWGAQGPSLRHTNSRTLSLNPNSQVKDDQGAAGNRGWLLRTRHSTQQAD